LVKTWQKYGTQKILLKDIGTGVYFLKVNTEDIEFIKKLIVTK